MSWLVERGFISVRGSIKDVEAFKAFGGAQQAEEVLALDQALHRLADRSERLARLVELRYFAGLTFEETAEALELSRRTVHREWRKARAFLFRELGGDVLQNVAQT